MPNLPITRFQDYYEPFVGGGAVYTAVQADRYFINDKSEELITLYRSFINGDRKIFFEALSEITHNWDLLTAVIQNNSVFFVKTYQDYSSDKLDDNKLKDILFEFILTHSEQFNGMFSSIFNFNIENFIKEIKINLIRKIKRMKELERLKNILPENDILDNIETALKSAFYMHFRHIYNNQSKYKINSAFKSAIFLFIRNFAYSGMFRYNSKGDFNVPYGGIAYNRKKDLHVGALVQRDRARELRDQRLGVLARQKEQHETDDQRERQHDAEQAGESGLDHGQFPPAEAVPTGGRFWIQVSNQGPVPRVLAKTR